MAALAECSDVFSNLSAKISQLLYGRTQNDRFLINRTLDELNSLNYRYHIVTNRVKAVLLVNQCCSLIPPDDFELVGKCCQLFVALLTHQNVVIEGRTQTVAVQWCLACLKQEKNEADILLALDSLLRSSRNYELISEVVKSEALLKLAKTSFLALQCLEACTFPPDDSKNAKLDAFSIQFRTCFDIFVNYLLNHSPGQCIKSLTVCLRGIQNLIAIKSDILDENLEIILGIVKTYMLYNLKGIDFLKPTKLMPSTLAIAEPVTSLIREKKGGKMTKHRKQKTQPALNKTKPENWSELGSTGYTPANTLNTDNANTTGNSLKTSDSDFSDTDGGNSAKIVIISGRVRQAALTLFLSVVKNTPKNVIFAYWTSFVPENSKSGKHNLTSCFLSDSSARGRMAALNVLLALLTCSKLYLQQAEKGENLSFTPFAAVMGSTIAELHRCLNLALCETSVVVLVQILKCIAALVQATPYHKLHAGLLKKLIRNVKNFINHRDATVQVASLIVLGCILAVDPILNEINDAFATDRNEESDFVDFSSEIDAQPWLLAKCLSNLGLDRTIIDNSIAVKLESLQIIAVISRNHFESLLCRNLAAVTKALDAALLDKYPNVRLHAGRAVDFIGQAINRYLSQQSLLIDTCIEFWQILLDNSLPMLLQADDSPILRATGCDCFGSIGSSIFEQLSREKQIVFVTLLFGCARDEDGGVRGAAVRALAISVAYPSLRDDIGYVIDTSEAILSVFDDAALPVRAKSSWALGNLSDALVLNEASDDLGEDLPDSLILKLLGATIRAGGDNDRVRMNAVRALGNFMQLVTMALINAPKFEAAIVDGFDVLVNNSIVGSNMKVRWNSCYALANAMKNPCVFSPKIANLWRDKVFGALADLVVNFRNFKVRINACVALASPQKRSFYGGGWYGKVWMVFGQALETSQNMDDFNEYKHRDNLVEQICMGMAHLVVLGTKEDLLALYLENSDFLRLQMRRVWERLVPEKATLLSDAFSHVDAMVRDGEVAAGHKRGLERLKYVFEQDF